MNEVDKILKRLENHAPRNIDRTFLKSIIDLNERLKKLEKAKENILK